MSTDSSRLDQIADEFEVRCKNLEHQGRANPVRAMFRMEGTELLSEFLEKVDETERVSLAKLLIPIDLEYRIRAGQHPTPNDYLMFGEPLAQIAKAEFDCIAVATRDSDDTVAPAAVATNNRSTRIGPYKLLQQIGEGGMGEVWMADQLSPVRRRVAIKLIKSDRFGKQTLARFEAERQALAMMDHQNIAKVLDAGSTETGAPYFVMELVQGVPFTTYCDKHKLSISDRLELFMPVCHAIQHAHQKGIIHRDLKPSNVLVSLYDGVPVPKVIDFGLAKALQHQSQLTDKTIFTEFGQVVGTLQYMSPEQAEMNQLDVDTRTDIYSLGVMLYELLTGSTPIDTDTIRSKAILQVLESIREKEPPRPSVRLSGSTDELIGGVCQQRRIEPSRLKLILRGELDWIVMKALEKDRTRRYDTANSFAEDIQNYLAGDIVRAKPPSKAYRLQKVLRKHSGLFASLAIIAALLIVGLVGIAWFAIDADSARREAQRKTGQVLLAKREADDNRDRADKNRSMALQEQERLRRSEAAANFQLAIARWRENRVEDALILLSRVPKEMRKFEWHYCNRRFLGSDLTVYDDVAISGLCVVGENNELTTVGADGSIKFWSKTGRVVNEFSIDSFSVVGLAVSGDGKTLVCGTENGNVIRVDPQTRKALWKHRLQQQSISSLCVSNNGSVVGAIDARGAIWLGKAETGEGLPDTISFPSSVTTLGISPNGLLLAGGTSAGPVHVWEIATGQQVLELNGHRAGVTSMQFFPYGGRLLTSSDDGSVVVWDTVTGDRLLNLLGHSGPVRSACVSPDGTRIASSAQDGSIWIWDIEAQRLETKLLGHFSPVTRLCFASDGARLFSMAADNFAKVWDVTSGFPDLYFRQHLYPVRSVAISTDQSKVASGDDAGIIHVWSRDPNAKRLTLTGHHHGVSSLQFSSDATFLVSGGQDNKAIVWDLESGRQRFLLDQHRGAIANVLLPPDDSWIATASWDGTVGLWDTSTGEQTSSISAHADGLTCACVSANGKQIATADRLGNIIVWEMPSGLRKQEFVNPNSSSVECLAFSPDGNELASGDRDRFIRIWDLNSKRLRKSLRGHRGEICSIDYSPRGDRLVSVGLDQSLKLWDIENGVESVGLDALDGFRSLDEQTGLQTARFSPDGTFVFTSDSYGAIRFWAAMPSAENRWYDSRGEPVARVGFSDDGTTLYSEFGQESNSRGMAWDFESGEQLAGSMLKPASTWRPTTPDERWLAFCSGSLPTTIDLRFKDSRFEHAYRIAKTRFRWDWHRRQAERAERVSDWYSATFHRALLLMAQPNRASAYQFLHFAHERLAARDQEMGRQSWLNPTQVAALNLPSGDYWTIDERRQNAERLYQVNNMLWETVTASGNQANRLPDARDVDELRRLIEFDPLGPYYNTLGLAEFRMGHWQAAILACDKSIKLGNEGKPDLAHPIDLAIIAMCHFRLGDREKVREYQERFQSAMEDPEHAKNPDCLHFQTELKLVLSGKETTEIAPPPDNSASEQAPAPESAPAPEGVVTPEIDATKEVAPAPE